MVETRRIGRNRFDGDINGTFTGGLIVAHSALSRSFPGPYYM
jgi:hypothetical protein